MSNWSIVSFQVCVSLLIFCLVDLSIGVSGVLKSHTAATAKSFQLCPTLCNPIDGSPSGSPVPGILQARILEWVAISFSRSTTICKANANKYERGNEQ